jgi:hypothetical protein
MAKTKATDLRAAKDRRKKIIAIVGAVLLLAVLAIQVPKTLKMVNRGQPDTTQAEAQDEENQGPQTAVPPVSFRTGSATETPPAESSAPAEGQLVSFSRFASKDPFVQQISAGVKEADAKPAGRGAGAGKAKRPAKKPATRGRASGSTGGVGGTGGGTDSQAGQLNTAVISINGAKETVQLGAAFPTPEKLFTLVSVTTESARIGIVGGTFANGAETMTIERGKTLKLMNAASGAVYQLRVVSTRSA